METGVVEKYKRQRKVSWFYMRENAEKGKGRKIKVHEDIGREFKVGSNGNVVFSSQKPSKSPKKGDEVIYEAISGNGIKQVKRWGFKKHYMRMNFRCEGPV